MPSNQRKRVRLATDNGSNSSNSSPASIAGPTALPVPNAQNNSSSQLSQIISQLNAAGFQFQKAITQFCALEHKDPSQTNQVYDLLAPSLNWHSLVLHKCTTHPSYLSFLSKNPLAKQVIATLYRSTHPTPTPVTADKSVATEPTPEPSKPSYSNVGCSTDPIPTPSGQPLDPSPSPSPKSGPRPPRPPCPKKAHPLTPRPRSHQVRSNVRLVACIAGRPDALTSETPRWKAVPTDCFSGLSKDLKAAAPGCTPLRFHCNQKGNLIITFAPTASRSLLMSNLNIIRGNFELEKCAWSRTAPCLPLT